VTETHTHTQVNLYILSNNKPISITSLLLCNVILSCLGLVMYALHADDAVQQCCHMLAYQSVAKMFADIFNHGRFMRVGAELAISAVWRSK